MKRRLPVDIPASAPEGLVFRAMKSQLQTFCLLSKIVSAINKHHIMVISDYVGAKTVFHIKDFNFHY